MLLISLEITAEVKEWMGKEKRGEKKSFSISSSILTHPQTCRKIALSGPEWLIRWISPRARPEEERKETI